MTRANYEKLFENVNKVVQEEMARDEESPVSDTPDTPVQGVDEPEHKTGDLPREVFDKIEELTNDGEGLEALDRFKEATIDLFHILVDQIEEEHIETYLMNTVDANIDAASGNLEGNLEEPKEEMVGPEDEPEVECKMKKDELPEEEEW